MTENELSCRLIQASNLAYAIDYGLPPTQQPVDATKLIKQIGLEPSTLKFKQVDWHACFYGETDNDAILAFRGTLPPSVVAEDPDEFISVVSDWLGDAKIRLVQGENLPGRVHKGFLESLDALWPDVQVFTADARKPLCVTGHSKGGALVFLASCRLSITGTKPLTVQTFASPRVGDADFATAFNAEFPHACRVEYRDDLVPHLPASTGAWLKILEGHKAVDAKFPLEAPHIHPELAKRFEDLIAKIRAHAHLNYTSAGTLRFFDWHNPPKPRPESRLLNLQRAFSLAEKIAERKFEEVIEDHFSNGGYLTSSCNADAVVGSSTPP
jgi:hypothetical protein